MVNTPDRQLGVPGFNSRALVDIFFQHIFNLKNHHFNLPFYQASFTAVEVSKTNSNGLFDHTSYDTTLDASAGETLPIKALCRHSQLQEYFMFMNFKCLLLYSHSIMF